MRFKRSIEEHKYTSTGIKFWFHMDQMKSYKEGTGRTVISTHISPTSKCNLNCDYCSVKKRDRQYEIEPDVIKKYILDLKSRGLKAVIFTGGGEPTIYKYFNEIVNWTKDKGLEVALITNGTLFDRVERETWEKFSWIRVSINNFRGWKNKIYIPKLTNPDCVIGSSFIYTSQSIEELVEVEEVARSFGSQYIRILPDCLNSQEDLLKEHFEIDEKLKILKKLGKGSLFFHQFKIHSPPKGRICHQSFFRPYLSEVDGGTVYPCDSVVLNNKEEHFARKYQLCKANEILDFLDGKIEQKFNVEEDCKGCVFTDNVNMLGSWKYEGKVPETIKINGLKHKNFP